MTTAIQERPAPTAQARRRAALRRIQSAWRTALAQSPAEDLERLAARAEQAVKSETDAGLSSLIAALTSGTAFDPAERLALELENQERLFRRRQELLADALTAPQVARLLRVSRQTPHDRARAGTLLAVSDRGASRFPAWQFDPDGPGGILVGLPEVLRALAVPPLAQVSWLSRPNAALDGRTPAEALRAGEAEQVLAEAHAVGVS